MIRKVLSVLVIAVALACGARGGPLYPSNFAGARFEGGRILDRTGAPYSGVLVARDGEIAEVAHALMAGTPLAKVPATEVAGLILILPVREGLAEGRATMRIDLTAKNLSGELSRRLEMPDIARELIGTAPIAEATFVGGKLDGAAIVLGPMARPVFEAQFRAGALHGPARQYFPGIQQVRRELVYEAGERTGRERTYYRDGKIDRDATYVAGERHGDYTERYANAALRVRRTYDHGRVVGTSRAWYPTGQLELEVVFDERGHATATEWYSNGGLRRQHDQLVAAEGVVEEFHYGGELKARTLYAHGLQHGAFEMFYASGKKWEAAEFANGRQVGTHRKWWKNGKVALEATYVDGKAHGPYRRYYASGKPWERIDYAAGKRVGRYQKWWKNGAVAHDYTYKDGRLDGKGHQFYDDGAKWAVTDHDRGKPLGTHERWFRDGRLGYVMHHVNGRPDGAFKQWWFDGKPRVEATFAKGLLDGDYRSWKKDGTVLEVATYRSGRKLKSNLPDRTTAN